ncbi:MAG: hypothetical protein V1489_00910 [Candidatus Liptonbacteria bacterium]
MNEQINKPLPRSTYSLPEYDFVVFSDAVLYSLPKLLHDGEGRKDKSAVKKYFVRGMRIFTSRLKAMEKTRGHISHTRQKELSFMLDALISAKQMLEE